MVRRRREIFLRRSNANLLFEFDQLKGFEYFKQNVQSQLKKIATCGLTEIYIGTKEFIIHKKVSIVFLWFKLFEKRQRYLHEITTISS